MVVFPDGVEMVVSSARVAEVVSSDAAVVVGVVTVVAPESAAELVF